MEEPSPTVEKRNDESVTIDVQGMHIKLSAMVLNNSVNWYACNKHIWINKLIADYLQRYILACVRITIF